MAKYLWYFIADCSRPHPIEKATALKEFKEGNETKYVVDKPFVHTITKSQMAHDLDTYCYFTNEEDANKSLINYCSAVIYRCEMVIKHKQDELAKFTEFLKKQHSKEEAKNGK